MNDIILKNVDPVLADRINRAAAARHWDMRETLVHLLELGLLSSESEVRTGFNNQEVDVLSDAISALREVPSGYGF